MANNRIPILGIFGSSKSESSQLRDIAYQLGSQTQKKFNLLTGACPGYPYNVAEGAFKNRTNSGNRIIGISPFENESEHLKRGMIMDYHDIIIFTGLGTNLVGQEAYNSRNNINVNTVDGAIVFPGSVGTISELKLVLSRRKPLVVISGIDDNFDYSVRDIVRQMEKGENGLEYMCDPKDITKYFTKLW